MMKRTQNVNKKFLALMLSAILVASSALIAISVKPAYATLSVAKGSFDTCGSTPCTNSVTLGFAPEALILFTTGDLVPNTGYQDDGDISIGFSDGTNHRSISANSEDAQSTTDACRTNSETLVLKHLSVFCNLVAGEATASFTANGFDIVWSNPLGTGASVQYIALGGDDLTDVKVGTITSGTSNGTKSYTGIGFQPNFIMFLYDRQSGTGVSDHAGFGMGFATSSTERGALMVVSEDGRTTSDTARAQRTDRVIYQLAPSNTANVDAEADFVSFDSDGFTLNWIAPDGLPGDTNDKFHYIAMKGGSYDVGKFDQKTSTGTQSITGVGFQPRTLLLASFNNVAATTIQSHNRISFGASDGAAEGAMWQGDRDSISSNTYVAQYFDTGKVVRLATEAQTHSSSTTDAEADLQSFDSASGGGFTLNWTTADSTAREIIYVAFGNTV